MPRQRRPDFSDIVVHVMNRSARGLTLLETELDHAAFERVLFEVLAKVPIRVLAYNQMPNHFHVVVWPRSTEELSRFMKLLTQIHAQRWRQARGTVGAGAVYQSRYKAVPVCSDEHLLWVLRYVERNACRAGLVTRAEDWPWGSLWRRVHGEERGLLSDGPVPLRSDWLDWVNEPQTDQELRAFRQCLDRSRPFGPSEWVRETAARLGLETSLRDPGRPSEVTRRLVTRQDDETAPT